jgi:hypothetical protein
MSTTVTRTIVTSSHRVWDDTGVTTKTRQWIAPRTRAFGSPAFSDSFCFDVDQDPIGCLALAAMAGHRVTVIEMVAFARLE